LLRPFDASSYVPTRVQTLAAPMSYALHHPALGPDSFDWAKLRANRKCPPHVASTYLAVKAMAEPQVIAREEIARLVESPRRTRAENKNPVCCCLLLLLLGRAHVETAQDKRRTSLPALTRSTPIPRLLHISGGGGHLPLRAGPAAAGAARHRDPYLCAQRGSPRRQRARHGARAPQGRSAARRRG